MTTSALARKLLVKPGHRVVVMHSPAGYADLLRPLPEGAELVDSTQEPVDVVQVFVRDSGDLERAAPAAIKAMKPDGLLWVCYPKGGKTRGATDLPATPWWTKSDVLGEFTGETGYKPVAFVKIDDNWTALRFKKG